MASRRNRPINLPAPYLKRIWLEPSKIADREAYPFCLPLLHDDFELSFDRAITIIVGENGTGKSTLLEGIAVLAGYDEAGGGKGYRSVDHSDALEKMGGSLSGRTSRKLASQDHQRMVLSRGEFFLGCKIPGQSGAGRPFRVASAGLPVPFPW
jgi:predicted ATPase